MKVLNFLLFAISIVSLSSCSLEDENHYDTYKVAFATVSEPNTYTGTFFLYLDDSTRLFTKEIGESQTSAAPSEGLRVLATYVELNKVSSSVYDYNIKITNVIPVLIDSVLYVDTIIKDSIGNDRWGRILLYAGADYLNLICGFETAGATNSHKFYLVKDTVTHKDNKLHLELLHNNGGDTGSTSAEAAISFDLSSLKTLYPDSLNLVIDTYQIEADSLTSYSFTYKWKK